MGFKAYLIFFSVFFIIVHNSNGCQMEGIDPWIPIVRVLEIYDIDRGEFFSRSTTSITGIQSVTYTEPLLNRGPYLEVTHTGSQFSIRTNDAYPDYEEYETESSMTFTVVFNCDGGTTNNLIFSVHIRDTNNNDPIFRTEDNTYEYNVPTPLLPGFQIPGCITDIFTRDIDLTTQRVDYQIYDSTYFEIAYDAVSSTVPKEFNAILRTTTFIRSIPEPLVFTISATDVDLTGDPRRTTYATVRISSEGEFVLPDDPVFSQTFYLATYTEGHQVDLQETISLSQGYHVDVEFSLKDSEYSHYFDLSRNNNEITINVDTQLPVELLRRHQLLLVVVAERSSTTSASATIVLQLPEGRVLSFEQNWYLGHISEETLSIPNLILNGGDDLEVQLTPIGDFATYFTLTQESNNVILIMSNTLPPEVVDNNAFIILDIQASYPEAVSGVTTVVLELVKEPIIHPIFGETYYIGQYSNEEGLLFEQTIRLAQGYDESVTLSLEGDDAEAFILTRNDENNYSLSLRDNTTPNLNERHQLVFSVVANKPDSTPARAAIIITVTGTILSFAQSSYAGVISDGSLDLPPLAVITGNDLPFQMRLIGDYQQHFSLTRESNNVIVSINSALPLPQDVIDENSFILLDVEVFYPNSVSGFTAIVLELIKEPIIHPVFDQAYYVGEYSKEGGIQFDQIIRLSQGFDETVSFSLDGADSQGFSLSPIGQNSFTLSLSEYELEDVIERQKLVFSVVAEKEDSITARAAIVIALTDLPEPLVISFAQPSYVGQIVEGSLSLGTAVTLTEGTDLELQLNPIGDFASYFLLTRESNNVIVTMITALPSEIVENNAFILLDIEASYPDAVSGFTTIIMELIKPPIIHPVFNEMFYIGQYSQDGGLQFEQQIQLRQGFDETVTFDLEGDDAEWFRLVPTSENSFTLTLTENEPENVIERQKLVFSVTAVKPDSITAHAAIVIGLTDLPEPLVISFAQASYVGQIDEGSLTLPPITLTEGTDLDLQLNLTGDYAYHFTPTRENNNIIVTLSTALPPETIENNAFISLDIEASYPEAVSGFTTLIVELVTEPEIFIQTPVFDQAYYIGEYTNDGNLIFDQTISLIQGFDENVSFTLDGENSEAFDLVPTDSNSYTLSRNENEIENLNDERQLVFSVVATKIGSIPGRAAIIITLTGTAANRLLGFERVNYLGAIVEDSINLAPIVLSEGYIPGVTFSLHGDLHTYFRPNAVGATVTLELVQPIPQEAIPSNGIILLSIEASEEQSLSAFATIVLEVEEDDDGEPSLPDPVFAEAFYVGTFTTNGGLVFDTPITLTEGYDSSVTFDLETDNSIWFDLVRSENSVTVIERPDNPIPPAVIANNNQLLFVVTAQRPGSATARATIAILFSDEIISDRILGFERVTYQGSIAENVVNLIPIVLSEGYIPGVSFSLHGDLHTYFRPNAVGATVTLELVQPIPQEAIPSNGIILLSIEASEEQSLSAFATIVLEVEEDDDGEPSLPDPVFAEAFYVGTFTTNGGLVFDTPITLTEGYDSSVTFDLETDNSIWFDLVRSENSVTVIVRPDNPIPPAVIANNNQLLFVVTAQRPGSATARATIAILLSDEIISDRILGFERVTYQGSIAENVVNLIPIVLSEGYIPGVSFSLHGDLHTYFRPNAVGATVTLELVQPIPQEAIPSNGIILLSIEASEEQSLSAFATIVLEVEEDDDGEPSLPDPVFAEAFYVGTFTTNGGLVFDTPITLTEGYDSSVTFDLETDNSIWFDLVRSENSVTVIVRPDNPIPPAVIANNNQLLFVVTAQRPGSATARATIAILLSDEMISDRILGFERVTYQGSIAENVVNLIPIVLSEGYIPGVSFSLHGDLHTYFRPNAVGATVTLELVQPIPQEAIPSNGIILLSIEASEEQSLSAFATIVLEVEEDDDGEPSLPDPVFAEAFYVGTFTTSGGLVFDTPITLTEGYDSSVTFDLETDNSIWFDLVRSENSVTVIVRPDNPIPPAVIANNNQLLFVVTAQRPGSATARATIAILLSDEIISDRILGFERVTYQGSIAENVVNLIPIVLSEGYIPGVSFSLHGDLHTYFRPNAVGATVTLEFVQPIPQEAIPSNGIILLSIEASEEQSLSAFATIVLEVEEDDDGEPSLPDPVFAEAFYVGTFTTNGGLVFDTPITLTEGYDSSVTFDLETDNSIWFDLVRSENSVTVIVRPDNPIPPAVIANNNQLLFVVTAQRPGSTTARATIVILLSDEIISDRILGFERVTYQGSIAENVVNLIPIVLSEGYIPGVSFSLHGDLHTYFRPNAVGATVTLELVQPIPQEAIPSNGIILLSIEASEEQSLSAFATIVLEVEEDDDGEPSLPDPVFAEAFYVGTFTTNGGLVFDTPITLTEGYDSSVTFDLETDNSIWFDLVRSENSVTVIVRPDNPIPPAVIANNNQLLFVVTAQRPGSATARATIAILLSDEMISDRILGFERVTYQGSIAENVVNLIPIVLSEGYIPGVSFSLHGDLHTYFRPNAVGATVTLELVQPIPQEAIPSNGIILLSIEASEEQSLSAFATIVLEVEEDDDGEPSLPDPVFAEAFYVGTFTTSGGLVFDTPITLTEGYDSSVTFDLETDNSIWFDLVRSENSVTVIVRPDNPIPPAVIANNNQLLFVVTAQRPGSATARATIAILLSDEIISDRILGFERVTYQGSIAENVVNLIPIVLSEGYIPGVSFSLHGDLHTYFRPNAVGATVTLEFVQPIPQEAIPSNGIILLSIEASEEQSLSAFATIVLEVEEDDDGEPSLPDPVFAEAFYVGTFTTNGGLVFDTPITLTEGYDSSVTFDLETDNSIWFDLVRSENSVTVIVRPDNPIPPAVIANNNQLLFVVTAQRPGSTTARATIVILLSDEIISDRILGFERVTYQGSIAENVVNLIPIVLSEGYIPGVSFSLHGDLHTYFRPNAVGATVTLELVQPIPQEAIPSNGIILLSIEASEEQSLSAFATIVLEVEEDDDGEPSLPDPVFAEAFYVGTFTTNGGLVFDTPITLTEGYDSSVTFDLETDNSIWFDLVRSENSVTVIVRPDNPIPPAVIANNNQLLFVVTAQRPGSATARATIAILLSDEIISDRILGFERVTYQGSIAENVVNLIPIVLSEGYIPGVSFSLHGDLHTYFRPNAVGATVTLELVQPIPQEAIPSNGIILLSIEASEEQSLSAFATIVLEVEEDDDGEPSLPDPVFAEAFYVGTFTTNGGLVFDTPITLTEGYDSSVTFDLETDNSIWFDLVRSENSVTVIVRPDNPIPPAVIANNNQLLFVVTAQRPGSATARATIAILLSDEIISDRILGFERVTYQGSIAENVVNLIPIVLSEGYIPGVSFSLHGDLHTYFRPNAVGATVTLELVQPIPQEAIPSNGIILLSIEASEEQSLSAFATIVLEDEEDDDGEPSLPDPVFAEAFYVGTFTTNGGLVFDTPITLTEGYDSSVTFDLETDNSIWFDLVRSENSVTVIVRPDNPIPPAVIANNNQLLFVVTAQRPGSTTARATIAILLSDEIISDRILGFERVTYQGSIAENVVNLIPIVLSEGYIPGVSFSLHGDLHTYFRPNAVGATVTLELVQPIPQEAIPSNGIILLSIEASEEQSLSAFATIVLEVEKDDDGEPSLPDLVFAEAFYVGTFTTNGGLVFDTPITLTEGYDTSVTFDLETDNSIWFDLVRSENSVTVIVRPDNPIPPAVIANNNQLLFVVTAQRPGSATARATIAILLSDEGTPPDLPPALVTFESDSYVVRVEIGQIGVVASVRASTDNGETVVYSLLVDNEHLQSRLSINSVGELRLSAPANSGIYNFQVVATAVFSETSGIATVHLSVEALTVCGNEPVIAPLIVLDRYEEQPLRDLVLLDPTEHVGCRYTLTSRWPANQQWLYVDETGLHATSIDREDPSIAFMALSQVQVDLTLVCDSDVTRVKRSISNGLDWLGPYNYGTNTWLLGETIRYNPRRSIVNLIVNDINDNIPIFVGKENEPLIVGYPVRELEQTVLPRSLAELQATDADIGINAALVYWSSEIELAVSPTTGFVHVRNDQQLVQDQILTVNATDLNGQGHTGSITLMVKLLNADNIAVITVRDAFLEDENRILGNISNAIGYEIRSLRSVVISETEIEQAALRNREGTITEASLEMYVYGLIQREPVAVDTLTTDIQEVTIATINIGSIQSLEDHVESVPIVDPGRDTALLVSTIVLAVLLFLLIVAAIIWFVLKKIREKKLEHDQFSDVNSMLSNAESFSQTPKPLDAAAVAKPRLNIEELKRSERRLQDMLNAPIENDTVEPNTSKVNTPVIPPPTLEPTPTIVIQDKLKDAADDSDNDEFGEVNMTRRKSVVTFNENVQKIIHVDENPVPVEDNYEVYKL